MRASAFLLGELAEWLIASALKSDEGAITPSASSKLALPALFYIIKLYAYIQSRLTKVV